MEVASSDPTVRRAFRRTKNELDKWAGLLCFSRNWKNPVQWAHYADRHRGLCLGFDVPDDRLQPVVYRTKPLKADVAAMNGTNDDRWAFYKRVLSTKFTHWRYENEVRLFIHLQDADAEGLYFMPFGDELALREVIVGHRSTLSREQLAAALGGDATATLVCKARLSFRSYTVVRQKHPDLW
nr:DUF2971 domain-containing protein [Bradyrhizobium lablabi]